MCVCGGGIYTFLFHPGSQSCSFPLGAFLVCFKAPFTSLTLMERTMKSELPVRNEQREVTDFGLLWWGKWTIKCNFKLNRCFMCNTILILFPQAEAEELHAVHLCVCECMCACVCQTIWEEYRVSCNLTTQKRFND